ETRVGTHVFAHLLTQKARIAPGGKAVEAHPEHRPESGRAGQQLAAERADGHEVADEGKARPGRHGQPQGVLDRLDPHLARRPWRFVEPDAGQAVALDPPLYPHEDLAVDGLRTGITAEQPAG